MKRVTLVLAIILASLSSSFAQTKVSSGSSNLEVQVKRAVENGADVYVDLLITSTGSLSFIEINTHSTASATDSSGAGCRFYDDEGRMYQSGAESTMLFEIDGNRSYWFPKLVLEKGVPRKMRIIVKNVDEYATSFVSAHIRYLPDGSRFSTDEGTIVIKNLPISR